MAKIPFKYYLNDSYGQGERDEFVAEQTGLSIEKIEELSVGQFAYEVELDCELDDVTGEVTILGLSS